MPFTCHVPLFTCWTTSQLAFPTPSRSFIHPFIHSFIHSFCLPQHFQTPLFFSLLKRHTMVRHVCLLLWVCVSMCGWSARATVHISYCACWHANMLAVAASSRRAQLCYWRRQKMGRQKKSFVIITGIIRETAASGAEGRVASLSCSAMLSLTYTQPWTSSREWTGVLCVLLKLLCSALTLHKANGKISKTTEQVKLCTRRWNVKMECLRYIKC